MTTKTITSVVSLAGLLKSIFVSGRFKKDLPMQIVDPKGNAVCEIRTEDPERWIRTNYKDSIACTRKLCTRSQWDKMDIVQQVKLCDCWEAWNIWMSAMMRAIASRLTNTNAKK